MTRVWIAAVSCSVLATPFTGAVAQSFEGELRTRDLYVPGHVVQRVLGDRGTAAADARRVFDRPLTDWIALAAEPDIRHVQTVRRAFEQYARLLARFGGEEGTADLSVVLLDRGLPVLEQTLDLATYDYDVSEIVSVAERPVPSDAFDVPAGYTRQPFPGMER